jgi:hypothetical protein
MITIHLLPEFFAPVLKKQTLHNGFYPFKIRRYAVVFFNNGGAIKFHGVTNLGNDQ